MNMFFNGILLSAAAFSCAAVARAETAAPVQVPAKGHVFFQSDFGGQQLLVENPGMKTFALPAEQMRGGTVRGSALVKAEQVSAKPDPWNGIKVMLAIETPDGRQWPQAPLDTGSFDWRRTGFVARIPTNATAVTLCLGLEKVTGKAWFDDVSIRLAKPPVTRRAAPVAGELFKGHDLPRLRGAMVSRDISAESLRTLGRAWNANLIRWQLIRHGGDTDYDAWLDRELKKLEAALPVCEEAGLNVVVDLHSPPGGKRTVSGYYGTDDRLFTDRASQDKFVAIWRDIARRFRDVRCIWGYDLANEPVEEDVAADCDDWHGLAGRAARAIREIDPARAIICEAPPWGAPESLKDFTPIAVSHVVYSVHMYVPGEFTHQGVHNKTQAPVRYPGVIGGRLWDKAALEKALKPVADFQRAYNVHIYIGEFSAIRWAPGDSGLDYLRDCIEIFESHGWDWSYHAFREWSGWSVEHGPDRADNKPATTQTAREKLLRDWFAKNRKPDAVRVGVFPAPEGAGDGRSR